MNVSSVYNRKHPLNEDLQNHNTAVPIIIMMFFFLSGHITVHFHTVTHEPLWAGVCDLDTKAWQQPNKEDVIGVFMVRERKREEVGPKESGLSVKGWNWEAWVKGEREKESER